MEVKKKLLDIVRDTVRFKHYSLSTEKTYIHWIQQYIFFHKKKHPKEIGKKKIEEYLTSFAFKNRVQNKPFSALLFLYKYLLGVTSSRFFGII